MVATEGVTGARAGATTAEEEEGTGVSLLPDSRWHKNTQPQPQCNGMLWLLRDR